jgi:hypothetical protein
MPITREALKNLLLVLEERYPNVIVTHDEINGPDIDPRELPGLLQFCLDEGWISCNIVDTLDGLKHFDLIRITSKGISHLRGI